MSGDTPQHLTDLLMHELEDIPFGDLCADIQTDHFCIDHRMVNRMVKVMNDFYLQHNDIWYRQHFSFLLNRQYATIANGLPIYEKLMSWTQMIRYDPILANDFIHCFYTKVKNVLQYYPDSKLGKNVTMCGELHFLAIHDCLTLGLLNEQLYQALQKEFCQKFYQLYLPLQRQFESRLHSLLKSSAFQTWMADPQLRHEYEVNELISLI